MIDWDGPHGGNIRCVIGLFDCLVKIYGLSVDGPQRISAYIQVYADEDQGSEMVNCSYKDEVETIEAGKQWCVDEVRRICTEALDILGQ